MNTLWVTNSFLIKFKVSSNMKKIHDLYCIWSRTHGWGYHRPEARPYCFYLAKWKLNKLFFKYASLYPQFGVVLSLHQ